MRQIKELLRLKHEHGLSVREIARSCGLPVSTVGDYLKRAEGVGLTWPLPEDLTEEQLVQKLLGGAAQATVAPPPGHCLLQVNGREIRRRGSQELDAGGDAFLVPPHAGQEYQLLVVNLLLD